MISVAALLVGVFVLVYTVANVYRAPHADIEDSPAAPEQPPVAEPAYDHDRAERLLAGYRIDGTIDADTYSYCMTKLAQADDEAHPLHIPSAWRT